MLRVEGPHQLPQKRSLAFVSILHGLAAAQIADALHLRDFRYHAIFEFFNTICQKQTFKPPEQQVLFDKRQVVKPRFADQRLRREPGVPAYCVEDFARCLPTSSCPKDAAKPKKAMHQKMAVTCKNTSLDAGSNEAHIRANAAMAAAP